MNMSQTNMNSSMTMKRTDVTKSTCFFSTQAPAKTPTPNPMRKGIRNSTGTSHKPLIDEALGTMHEERTGELLLDNSFRLSQLMRTSCRSAEDWDDSDDESDLEV